MAYIQSGFARLRQVGTNVRRKRVNLEYRDRGYCLARANLPNMLTPQTSELHLAALLQEAGLDQWEALRVARRAHDSSIRDKAATNIEAIAHVIAEHYYSYASGDPEESFWKGFQSLETSDSVS
jgi:hypothetical protein